MTWETMGIPDPEERAQKKWEAEAKLARYRGDPEPPNPRERELQQWRAQLTHREGGDED